jgi:rhamnose utilization protein RhaD (predicted bifunctional aldolase and dehydrogenase)
MPEQADILKSLIALSRWLGEPSRELAILGEGNTSARLSQDAFLVKASGKELASADEQTFVEVSLAPTLAILEASQLTDAEIKLRLDAAKTKPSDPARPSVETILHALALVEGDANFVAHSHPISVNAILCSHKAEEAFAGRLFPDEIVLCGPAPAFIPYTDPGLPLAAKFREVLRSYRAAYGQAPKMALIQNHGLVTFGRTAQEAQNITAMMDKVARILIGSYALGGPHALTQAQVERIHTRPDEAYRRQQLR